MCVNLSPFTKKKSFAKFVLGHLIAIICRFQFQSRVGVDVDVGLNEIE